MSAPTSFPTCIPTEVPTRNRAQVVAIANLMNQINESLESQLSASVNISFLMTNYSAYVSEIEALYTAQGWTCTITTLAQPWTGSGVGTPTPNTTMLTIQ